MPEKIPADVPVDVFIARSLLHLGNRAKPFVAILPNRNSWNDYGRNFFAYLHIQPAARDAIDFSIRVMFQGRPRSEPVFDELLEQFGNVFPAEMIQKPFVSLLLEVDQYRQLIDSLGFEIGVSALRKINDATVARTEGINQQLLSLIEDEEFHIGALRNGGAYDALRRGSRFFRPDLPDAVEDAAIDFAFSARLPSADNPYTLPFRFNQRGIFRNRASVLIGRNGVGKTQLLKSIVDGLHSNHPDGYRRPHFQPVFRPSRVLVFSSVPTDPFPRSIGPWHGIDYEYFAVNASQDNQTDSLLASLVACRKSGERISFGQNRNKSRMDVIQDALEPIGLWKRLCLPLRARRENDDLRNFIEVDGQIYFPFGRGLNELDSIRVIQQIDWSRKAAVLDDNKELRQLSSGEYAMLRFASQACAAIEQGSLLILDEPETHLHPNFISDLMEILDNLLQSTQSVAIIATHSSYVVRETPSQRVNVLTLENREISVDTPRMQTFGATIDSISQFVFRDTTISHRFQKTLADWADRTGRAIGIEGVVEQYGAELNSESLSFIARRLAMPPAASPEPEAPEAI